MDWTLLFNPFKKIPSKALILLGLLCFIAFSIYSWMNQIIYDGMLDIHLDDSLKPLDYFNANAVNLIIPVFLFFGIAAVINSKTRVSDIFATALIYRLPIYVASLFIKTEAMANVANKIEDVQGNINQLHFSASELLPILGISILSLLLIVWAVALLFFGFKTACNAKKWWHYALFIVGVIAGELITKTIINAIV